MPTRTVRQPLYTGFSKFLKDKSASFCSFYYFEGHIFEIIWMHVQSHSKPFFLPSMLLTFPSSKTLV